MRGSDKRGQGDTLTIWGLIHLRLASYQCEGWAGRRQLSSCL